MHEEVIIFYFIAGIICVVVFFILPAIEPGRNERYLRYQPREREEWEIQQEKEMKIIQQENERIWRKLELPSLPDATPYNRK